MLYMQGFSHLIRDRQILQIIQLISSNIAKSIYSVHEQIPLLNPLPLFSLENEIRGGVFYDGLSRIITERIQKPQLG